MHPTRVVGGQSCIGRLYLLFAPPPSPHRTGCEQYTLRLPPPEVATVLQVYSVGVLGTGQCLARPKDLQQYGLPRNMGAKP